MEQGLPSSQSWSQWAAQLPRRSPWARWACTALSSTVMVWKLAGLPGGTWQTFTLAAQAGAPRASSAIVKVQQIEALSLIAISFQDFQEISSGMPRPTRKPPGVGFLPFRLDVAGPRVPVLGGRGGRSVPSALWLLAGNTGRGRPLQEESDARLALLLCDIKQLTDLESAQSAKSGCGPRRQDVVGDEQVDARRPVRVGGRGTAQDGAVHGIVPAGKLVHAGAGHRHGFAAPIAGVARLSGRAGDRRKRAIPGQRIAGVDRAQVGVLADFRRAMAAVRWIAGVDGAGVTVVAAHRRMIEQAVLVGVAGVDGAGIAVVAELVAMGGATAQEVPMGQVGLHGVVVDGDRVEVGRVAGRHVADLHFGRPGRRAEGEQRDRQGTTDRGFESHRHLLPRFPGDFERDAKANAKAAWGWVSSIQVRPARHGVSILSTDEFLGLASSLERMRAHRKRGGRPPWKGKDALQKCFYCGEILYKPLPPGIEIQTSQVSFVKIAGRRLPPLRGWPSLSQTLSLPASPPP